MIPPCLHADKRESNKLIHKAIYCLIGKIWLEIQTLVRFLRNRQLGLNNIMDGDLSREEIVVEKHVGVLCKSVAHKLVVAVHGGHVDEWVSVKMLGQ